MTLIADQRDPSSQVRRLVAATAWLDPVRAALDGLDSPTDVFFRVDGADRGHDRFDHLLGVFSARGLACDVAVDPAGLSGSLIGSLTGWGLVDGIRLHQRGRPRLYPGSQGGERSGGSTGSGLRAVQHVARDRSTLRREFAGLLDDVFTAPDNRCTPDLGALLISLGLTTLSRDSSAAPLGIAGLVEVPVTVAWSVPSRRPARARAELGRHLAGAIERPGPLGIQLRPALTDHDALVMIDQLLRLLRSHAYAVPTTLAQLAGPSTAATTRSVAAVAGGAGGLTLCPPVSA